MGTGGLHEGQSESENDREHRFKPHRVESDWLKESRQEDDWTRVMTSVMRLTVWESGSDVKTQRHGA